MTGEGTRVLTVRQPWAWALVTGRKPVENRAQMFTYRGPVAIHASAAKSNQGLNDHRIIRAAAEFRQPWQQQNPLDGSSFDGPRMPMRAIIGAAHLVDCHRDTGCCGEWAEHGPKVTHLRFEGMTRFQYPIPHVRGQLGLPRAEPTLAKLIHQAWAIELQRDGAVL